jgi:hypothetical protein
MGSEHLLGPYLVCLNNRLDKRFDEKSDLEGKFSIVVFNNKKLFGEISLYSDSLYDLGKDYIKSDTAKFWKRPVRSMWYNYNLVPTDKGIFSVNITERKDISEFGNGIIDGVEKIEHYPYFPL